MTETGRSVETEQTALAAPASTGPEANGEGVERDIEAAAGKALEEVVKSAAKAGFPPLPGVGIDIVTLGTMLARSGYFQDVKRISQAVVKILAGQELGIGPIRAMAEIHVVESKPALGAALIAALIKRSGRYDYRIKEHTDQVCELEFFQREGLLGADNLGKLLPVGSSRFSMEDAMKAGLPKRSPSWHSYPRNMLFARAISNGARWYCADVFGGAVYTPEELGREELDTSGASAPKTNGGE